MTEPRFLTLAEVLEIHADQIRRYGGSPGVRDMGLLQSALGQPSAGFGDEYFHKNVYEMAAAYAFHLASNHPFVDGNKRAALASALVFLELNGVSILDPRADLYRVMIDMAKGARSKQYLANVFARLHKPR